MIRNNPITGEPVILAPHRADRPHLAADASSNCPFCRGHESETPPEITHVGEPWRLRVFPNKYPATDHHEVVVESASHDETFDGLPLDDATAAVELYRDRAAALMQLGDVQYVTIFKNHGAAAGASIAHMHSQIIATPFMPPRVEREAYAFAAASECPLCVTQGIVIDETSSLRWYAPAGSSMPYEQWIVPREHQADVFASPRDLATLLQSASRAMLTIRDSFNWMLMNFPRDSAGHGYVQLFPRLAVIAGFEIASGSGIDIIDPASAADTLRAASGASSRP